MAEMTAHVAVRLPAGLKISVPEWQVEPLRHDPPAVDDRRPVIRRAARRNVRHMPIRIACSLTILVVVLSKSESPAA